MVKFGEIVKVTEARKPKNGAVHLKYKNGALLKKIDEILDEKPGLTSKQLSRIIYPGDPKGEARLATWLWSRVKSNHAPFVRRKLDGLWRYYPSNYKTPTLSEPAAEQNKVTDRLTLDDLAKGILELKKDYPDFEITFSVSTVLSGIHPKT